MPIPVSVAALFWGFLVYVYAGNRKNMTVNFPCTLDHELGLTARVAQKHGIFS